MQCCLLAEITISNITQPGDGSLVCDCPLTDLLFGRLKSMRTERVNASAVFDAEVAEVDVEKTQRDQTCTETQQQGEEMSLFLII